MTAATKLPLGHYMFTWKDFWHGYETGSYVVLMIDGATGVPIAYNAGHATRAPSCPPVDELRAQRLALRHIEETMPAGAAIRAVGSRCVLSVPSAAGGPVWFISIEVGPAELHDRRLVFIDGATGEVIHR